MVDVLPRLLRHGLLGTTLLGGVAHADGASENSIAFTFGCELGEANGPVFGVELRHHVDDADQIFARFELGHARGAFAARMIAGGRRWAFADGDTAFAPLAVELAVALEFRARFSLAIGALYGRESFLAARVRIDGRPAPTSGFGAGIVVPIDDRNGHAVPGRPLLVDGRAARPRALSRHATSAEDRAVRDHFVDAAQLEYSSVWAFLRLAAELAAVGAPHALILAALDAADDEVRHAAQCAQAAGGVQLVPLPMALAQPRFTRRSPHALALLAREAWFEGCLNEGTAAEEARLTSLEAGANAAMLAAIAVDEARHAELSWRVLAWIHAIAPEVVIAFAAPAPAPRAGDPALLRHGIPSAAITREAAAFATRHARSRLRALG